MGSGTNRVRQDHHPFVGTLSPAGNDRTRTHWNYGPDRSSLSSSSPYSSSHSGVLWSSRKEKDETIHHYQAIAQDILEQLLHQRSQRKDDHEEGTKKDVDDDESSSSSTESTRTTLHLLDVTDGTDGLWESLFQQASQKNLQLNITVLDVSSVPRVDSISQQGADESFVAQGGGIHDTTISNKNENMDGHSIQFIQSSIESFCEQSSQYIMNDQSSSGAAGGGKGGGGTKYDGILLSAACFGSLTNPRAVLEALPGPSTIMVTHPLGISSIQQQREEWQKDQDPEHVERTIHHTLPTSTLDMVRRWTFGLPIVVSRSSLKRAPYYLLTMHKQQYRAQTLSILQRYRGPVDSGYGRGGKKLGVPTANLPSSYFQNALAEISTGVYFGWAALEDEEEKEEEQSPPSSLDNDNYDPTTISTTTTTTPTTNTRVYPAVVNVGFSPTFEGQENKEKIIEAHLILGRRGRQQEKQKQGDDGDEDGDEPTENVMLPDFYGTTMRLQLCGYLRPEQKFDSFPALVAQIHADIDDARTALEEFSPFVELQSDPFLNFNRRIRNEGGADDGGDDSGTAWIGSGGGNSTASWEFVNHLETLQEIVVL